MTQFVGISFPFILCVALIGTVTIQVVIIFSLFAVFAMIHGFDHKSKICEADLETGKGILAATKGLNTTLQKLCTFIGIEELSIFFIIGWVNLIFLFLFFFYLI